MITGGPGERRRQFETGAAKQREGELAVKGRFVASQILYRRPDGTKKKGRRERVPFRRCWQERQRKKQHLWSEVVAVLHETFGEFTTQEAIAAGIKQGTQGLHDIPASLETIIPTFPHYGHISWLAFQSGEA